MPNLRPSNGPAEDPLDEEAQLLRLGRPGQRAHLADRDPADGLHDVEDLARADAVAPLRGGVARLHEAIRQAPRTAADIADGIHAAVTDFAREVTDDLAIVTIQAT